ncbi:hypothetical protein KJ781_03510 [Patescibacteria group bacterium]|nr:hypothetical protein [Patescibacteria group bacterium]MBU1448377.1 hypothetical protein [Patescibacteria group bacterium]MBU2613419.1 hypothetical protein [Patescibacteria group bacterium]
MNRQKYIAALIADSLAKAPKHIERHATTDFSSWPLNGYTPKKGPRKPAPVRKDQANV